MNITLENYLSMFQSVSILLSKRSSESVFMPTVTAYKTLFDEKVYQLIEMAKNSEPEHLKNVLRMAESSNAFLEEKLDPAMIWCKQTNISLYNAYLQSRRLNSQMVAKPDYEGRANSGYTQIVHIPYLSSRNFLFKNNGSVPLSFALSMTFNTQKANIITLAPLESAMRSSGVLNADGWANKIYAINNNEKITGNYQIWIL